jgi:hypothetical protein
MAGPREREMISNGASRTPHDKWPRLIAAVEEALRLGVSDSAEIIHILNMPDPDARQR